MKLKIKKNKPIMNNIAENPIEEIADQEEGFKFNSVQNSESFNGYGNDVDRHIQGVKEENSLKNASINRYGVRVRTNQSKVLKDDDEIKFSVNNG